MSLYSLHMVSFRISEIEMIDFHIIMDTLFNNNVTGIL